MTRLPNEFIPEAHAVIEEDDDWMARFEKGDRVSLVLEGGRGDKRRIPVTAVYRCYVVPETGNDVPAGIGGFDLPNGDHTRVYFGDRTAVLYRERAVVSLPLEAKFHSIQLFDGWSQ